MKRNALNDSEDDDLYSHDAAMYAGTANYAGGGGVDQYQNARFA